MAKEINLTPITSLDSLRAIPVGTEVLLTDNSIHNYTVVGNFEEIYRDTSWIDKNDPDYYIVLNTSHRLDGAINPDKMSQEDLLTFIERLTQPGHKQEPSMGYAVHNFPERDIVKVYTVERNF